MRQTLSRFWRLGKGRGTNAILWTATKTAYASRYFPLRHPPIPCPHISHQSLRPGRSIRCVRTGHKVIVTSSVVQVVRANWRSGDKDGSCVPSTIDDAPYYPGRLAQEHHLTTASSTSFNADMRFQRSEEAEPRLGTCSFIFGLGLETW